jgi:hypothetical protein
MMTFHSHLEDTPVPDDHGDEGIAEDVKALMNAATMLYSAFKAGEDFHAETLQVLERAHRLAVIHGGPNEYGDGDGTPEVEAPAPGSYGVFTKDQLAADHIMPGRPIPTMSWAKTFESFDEAVEAAKLEETDETLYVGRFTEDNEAGGYWVNIVYFKVQELPEE